MTPAVQKPRSPSPDYALILRGRIEELDNRVSRLISHLDTRTSDLERGARDSSSRQTGVEQRLNGIMGSIGQENAWLKQVIYEQNQRISALENEVNALKRVIGNVEGVIGNVERFLQRRIERLEQDWLVHSPV